MTQGGTLFEMRIVRSSNKILYLLGNEVIMGI